MESEDDLKESIKNYTNQLQFVQTALDSDSTNEDLLLLKSNLEEVLRLTHENLLSLKKKNLLASLADIENGTYQNNASSASGSLVNDNFEDELKLFQSEISRENDESELQDDDDHEIASFLSELEGKKCRAPYSEEWGQLAYHNAIVFSVIEKEIDSIDGIEVRVLFCNPVCQSMKPCTFFLDGHCKFSSEQCRFSHGYNVKLADLQDFKDPDYNLLQRDSYCLAKYKDELWYKAMVEDVLDDHQYSVKYVTYNETVVRGLEDLVPLEYESESSSDDDSVDDSEDERKSETEEDDLQIRILASEKLANGPLGDWEKHTKGFGSKLMVQMGYIMGQGLGRNGEGITEPIEATILPQGKSLDRCMEIREMKAMGCDPKALIKKRRKKDTQEKEIVEGYHQDEKKNIFDFINSKIKQSVIKHHEKEELEGVKNSTSKNLNVKLLRISEDLKKAQKEMSRLKQSLKRNKESRDRKMQLHVENRIADQENVIKSLQSQEKMIHFEQNSRHSQKKLTVF